MKIARYYISELEQCLIVPKCEEKEKPVFHRFIVQHEERDRLKQFLQDKGVMTAVNYPLPLHLHEASEAYGYKKGDFAIAEDQASKILSLPIYPELKDIQIEYVVECIKEFCAL